MYAWSNFVAGLDPKTNQYAFRAKPGDEISQDDLECSDEEWDAIVAMGSAREQEYPKAVADGSYPDSPNKYFTDQMAKAAEGLLSGDEVQELTSAGIMTPVPAEPEPQKASTSSAAKK
jgi:hypothetical protein